MSKKFKFNHDSDSMDPCEGYCTCFKCNHNGVWTCAEQGCSCCTKPIESEENITTEKNNNDWKRG